MHASEWAESPGGNEPGAEFIEEILGPGLQLTERREFVRYPITRQIVVVPLDDEGRPQQQCLNATLLDISVAGAKFYLHEELDADWVVIDFGPAGCPGRQVVARIRWKRQDLGVTKSGCEYACSPSEALPLS